MWCDSECSGVVSRLRDEAGGEIEGMLCPDGDILIDPSTMVDDGGDKQPPLSTLGMLRMLGCNLDSCLQKFSGWWKEDDTEACCRFGRKGEDGC